MDVSEHASEIRRDIIAAYRATRFRVDAEAPFWLTVDVHSPPLAALLRRVGCREAVYITAWNPLGEPADAAENAVRQARLLEELRASGRAWINGAGEDPRDVWAAEASLLVFGVGRAEACALGARHEQNAVLWVADDAVPRLLLLR